MDELTNDLLLQYLTGFPRMLLLPALILCWPLEKRKNWLRGFLTGVLMMGADIGLGFLLFPPLFRLGMQGSVYFAVHYLMVLLIYGCAFYMTCEINWKEAAYCVVCAYMVQHLNHCFSLVAGQFLNHPAWLSNDFVEWLQQGLVCLAVYFLFVRKICYHGHYPDSALRSLALLTIIMAVMYFLSIHVSSMENGYLHGLYTGLLIIALMAEEWRSASQLRLQKEAQTREQMDTLHRAQYEMSKENIALINRKSHDLKRQISALRTVATPEEQAETLAQIEQAVQIYDSTYQTGCRALDTVLMQKALVCSQNGIELTAVADGGLLAFIKSVDLYTMVSNILDNAIEANLHIQDTAGRAIHLSVHEKKGLIILQCENPYEGTIEMKDGFPVTIKQDRANHGIGTRSIAATAAAYGGTLRIDPGGGMYVLRIIFQPPDANQAKKTTNQDKAA